MKKRFITVFMAAALLPLTGLQKMQAAEGGVVTNL